MNLFDYLSKRSRSFLLASGFVLITIVGLFDYLTGAEISFSIFYLIPVSLVAWVMGRRDGYLMSIASAIVWLTADLLAEHAYSHTAIPYWNAIVRLGFFSAVTFSLSSLSATLKRRDELAQFIFHDLRAPLSNVIAALRAARQSEVVKTDPDLDDWVRMSLVSCNRMATLIQSLLDLARLESGQMELHREETGVKELIESSLNQVSVWAGRSRVILTSQLAANIQKVYADPALTERVLVNLLSNAIKFSPPGSIVTVRVEPSGPKTVAISVADKGPGIPKEWAEKVFERFAQAELVRRSGEVGTGLGLTFCRMAVEAQGGHIRLESEINVGTTITFTLPESGG